MGILRDTYIINKTKMDLTNFNREIRHLNKTMKENCEKEIAAKNRVNISLEEYESMKEEIKSLKEEIKSNARFVKELGMKIKRDPNILFNSEILDVEIQRNPERYSTILRVAFEIKNEDMI